MDHNDICILPEQSHHMLQMNDKDCSHSDTDPLLPESPECTVP